MYGEMSIFLLRCSVILNAIQYFSEAMQENFGASSQSFSVQVSWYALVSCKSKKDLFEARRTSLSERVRLTGLRCIKKKYKNGGDKTRGLESCLESYQLHEKRHSYFG